MAKRDMVQFPAIDWLFRYAEVMLKFNLYLCLARDPYQIEIYGHRPMQMRYRMPQELVLEECGYGRDFCYVKNV